MVLLIGESGLGMVETCMEALSTALISDRLEFTKTTALWLRHHSIADVSFLAKWAALVIRIR